MHMEPIPERIGLILAVESEDGDLSEGESYVLEVQLDLKGETVSRPKTTTESSKCSVRGRLKQHIKFWERGLKPPSLY